MSHPSRKTENNLSRRKCAWDEKVRAALGRRYEGSPRALAYCIGIWTTHLDAGLADVELVSALAGEDECTRRQRIWEMQLAAHLHACGHTASRKPEGQPDYSIEFEGRVIFVEAISPAPGDWVPSGGLDAPSTGRVAIVPHEWALSRWTAALKEEQAKGAVYERRGVVKPDDAYVIAIDGGQLSQFPLPHGASRLPFALEATLAMGPLNFTLSEDSRKVGTKNELRLSFKNHNGSDVRTEPFLRRKFANVSAVLGCCPPMFAGPLLPVQVIHNPLARVQVSPGTFGTEAEGWQAVEVEEGEERFWQVGRC